MGNNPFRNIREIEKCLEQKIDQNLGYTSRIHPLHTFGEHIYVKREDESGFGSSGSKRRKFASLIPHLIQEEVELALLIGGANSNHIVAATQLLRQYGIPFQLFLKKYHGKVIAGNSFLIHLLEDEKNIQWIEKNDWPRVESMALDFGKNTGKNCMLIPEGGMCFEAVAGAASLMLDIVKNEQNFPLFREEFNASENCFDHIWVDSGTGLMAATLVAMNALLNRKTEIHVVLIAGDEAYFLNIYKQVASWLSNILKLPIPPISNFRLHFPLTGRSFGNVNKRILQSVKYFARTEGLLTDPIYTAKLFLTAQEQITSGKTSGVQLIIHSGGGTGLMGFAEKMAKRM